MSTDLFYSWWFIFLFSALALWRTDNDIVFWTISDFCLTANSFFTDDSSCLQVVSSAYFLVSLMNALLSYKTAGRAPSASLCTTIVLLKFPWGSSTNDFDYLLIWFTLDSVFYFIGIIFEAVLPSTDWPISPAPIAELFCSFKARLSLIGVFALFGVAKKLACYFYLKGLVCFLKCRARIYVTAQSFYSFSAVCTPGGAFMILSNIFWFSNGILLILAFSAFLECDTGLSFYMEWLFRKWFCP